MIHSNLRKRRVVLFLTQIIKDSMPRYNVEPYKVQSQIRINSTTITITITMICIAQIPYNVQMRFTIKLHSPKKKSDTIINTTIRIK